MLQDFCFLPNGLDMTASETVFCNRDVIQMMDNISHHMPLDSFSLVVLSHNICANRNQRLQIISGYRTQKKN
jgi:hypothetical protein